MSDLTRLKRAVMRYLSAEAREWSPKCATGAGCRVMLDVWGCRNATFPHASISSGTVLLLWLSGANYSVHKFRLQQQSDVSSHLSDSTLELVEQGKLSERGLVSILGI